MSGTIAYSGAFCGAFVSEDDKFIGVGFKGTSSWRDAVQDGMIQAFQSPAPVLYGEKVHTGFYTGLFDMFKQGDVFVQPFTLIMGGLSRYDKSYYTHITGHSLGGAYTTLLHCELNRLEKTPTPPTVTVKDELTFGSPRTAFNALANRCGDNMQPGQSSWRFANNWDPVPALPPRKVLGYTHIDTGYKLYKDSDPTKIPSERNNGGEDSPVGNPPEDRISTHAIKVYYAYVERLAG